MAYRLSENVLEIALRHLCRFGDTDIFPHLPELAFFADCEKEIVSELRSLDLDTYSPGGAVEALAPKSRYGFRIAHQLTALDNLLMLASAIELGPAIEAQRSIFGTFRSFSYRFAPDPDGRVFDADQTYKDWLHAQSAYLAEHSAIAAVVTTDISDFYARVNFHRLDNLLDHIGNGHGATRFLKKQIKIIRAKQSFGLPVGGTAARLLAELALLDTDRALMNQGVVATRFVDDFRIFLASHEDPYDVLGFLAEQLGINEGLSLNVAKTSVSNKAAFEIRLNQMTTEVRAEAEGVAIEKLTAEIYSEDRPNEDDIAKLRDSNLIGFLENEVAQDQWDMGRIKVIFRALRITTPAQARTFIVEHLKELVVFAKELCLLMEALERKEPGCFNDILDGIVDVILTPPASSIQVIRTWLLELFVRGVVEFPLNKLRFIEALPSSTDKRQILLIRGRCGDVNYFRRQKTAIDQMSGAEQSCLVWGASCLPVDEYETWLSNIRPMFNRPLGELFLRWARQNRLHLIDRLAARLDEHPE